MTRVIGRKLTPILNDIANRGLELATIEDIPDLLSCKTAQQMEYWGDQYDPSPEFEDSLSEFYRRHLNTDVFMFVKRVCGVIVATLAVHIFERIPSSVEGSIEGWLCDAYTAKQHRRKGYHRQLMSACLEFGECYGIHTWRVKSENKVEIGLLHEFGFQMDNSILVRR